VRGPLSVLLFFERGSFVCVSNGETFVTGEHKFSWAVLPHQGHFLESDVPMAGYLFNSPLHGWCFPSLPFPSF
jgi:alpha-mannosidase